MEKYFHARSHFDPVSQKRIENFCYLYIKFQQGAFQFLKLYGYPDVIPTLCNKFQSVSIFFIIVHTEESKYMSVCVFVYVSTACWKSRKRGKRGKMVGKFGKNKRLKREEVPEFCRLWIIMHMHYWSKYYIYNTKKKSDSTLFALTDTARGLQWEFVKCSTATGLHFTYGLFE